MMSFINGGNHYSPGRRRNHEANKIIISVAGGNVITIFAKLVYDLLEHAMSDWESSLSTFNYKIYS